MPGTSLLKYTDSSPEVIGWGHILEELAARKLASKVPKYGPLLGTDTTFSKVLTHLLEEVMEFLVAFYPDNWMDILAWMSEVGETIEEKEGLGEPDKELIDIINVAFVTYIYGKIQGDI